MILNANCHTHSTFCDGKNTIAEMAEAAFNAGIKHLGFTSHAAWPITTGLELQPDKYGEYKAQILEQREKFKDKLEILIGLEADYIPPVTAPDYSFYSFFEPDFLIGSVHYISSDDAPENGIFAVDDTPEFLKKGIDTVFLGNTKKAVQTYFLRQRQMLEKCDFDIIGHVDLIRKYNETVKMFDENESWYKNELKATAKCIKKNGAVVEINTGAMSRQIMNNPYPSLYFLELLQSLNVPVMINSDAHSINHITYGFEEALSLAKKAGYKEIHFLTLQGWKTQSV